MNSSNALAIPVTPSLSIDLSSPRTYAQSLRAAQAAGTTTQQRQAILDHIDPVARQLRDGIEIPIAIGFDGTGSMMGHIRSAADALAAMLHAATVVDPQRWPVRPRVDHLVIFRDRHAGGHDSYKPEEFTPNSRPPISLERAIEILRHARAMGGGGNHGEDSFDTLATIMGIDRQGGRPILPTQGTACVVLVTDESPLTVMFSVAQIRAAMERFARAGWQFTLAVHDNAGVETWAEFMHQPPLGTTVFDLFDALDNGSLTSALAGVSGTSSTSASAAGNIAAQAVAAAAAAKLTAIAEEVRLALPAPK